MCVLIFSTLLSVTFLIIRRIQRDFFINTHTHTYSCNVLVILVRFQRNLMFSTDFRKIFNYKVS